MKTNAQTSGKRITVSRAIVTSLALMVMFLFTAGITIPQPINYKAKLKNSSGQPLTGSHTIYASIYQGGSPGVAGSGTLKFSEHGTVNLTDGILDFGIGQHTNTFGSNLRYEMFKNQPVFVQIAVDDPSNVVLPREQLQYAPLAFTSEDAFRKDGESFVTVELSDTPLNNAVALVNAYYVAKNRNPYGLPRSPTNRVTVLVPPGKYGFTGGFTMNLDTDYVDVVGVSAVRDDQFLDGVAPTISGANGILRQSASDVRIENLVVSCSRSGGPVNGDATDPAAYHPESDTTATVIRNCEFRDDGLGFCHSTRWNIIYSGVYTNCKAGTAAFGNFQLMSSRPTAIRPDRKGARAFLFGTIASGKFTNCTGGDYSFGGEFGQASGTFTDCRAGNLSFAPGGLVSGTFTRCTAGDYSFAAGGTASGTFTDCTAGSDCYGRNGFCTGTFINCTGGYYAFGSLNGIASGTFTRCTGDFESFGGNGSLASGSFTDCKGGVGSFGSGTDFDPNVFAPGVATGTFTNCIGGDRSFAGTGSSHLTTASASGTFIRCTGGDESFGAAGGLANGSFTNCTAGAKSFGGDGDIPGNTVGARLSGCRMNSPTWTGTFSGRMENCYWGTGLKCAAGALIYGSIFAGTLDLNNTACGVAQSRAESIINNGSNLFGATNAFALNIANPDVN